MPFLSVIQPTSLFHEASHFELVKLSKPTTPLDHGISSLTELSHHRPIPRRGADKIWYLLEDIVDWVVGIVMSDMAETTQRAGGLSRHAANGISPPNGIVGHLVRLTNNPRDGSYPGTHSPAAKLHAGAVRKVDPWRPGDLRRRECPRRAQGRAPAPPPPRVPGSVNVEGAYALLEPGVSLLPRRARLPREAQPARAFFGSPCLWAKAPSSATPYGDHWGMHCGMEVVLPKGKLVRASMGGEHMIKICYRS
ncbi:putative Alpha methylacyl-CoA racemase [Colletotrichum higginsianum IMI 349063]|uniref:Putative Alpha methylacyl-CoA racemase n=1 Tax=Colletotrichum higginsianum (strain IMI 349063) TaxID=759273 RepID=A0A1B7YER8_COLHI|nr:putative Alpha methylacyl-CoA racemase [Colletotrichum higginsianum IMI 349063]OBR10583.1 putative Alpha methylacyl-CoA racemase [Colletotrichum higginsianum IMI 349063]